MLFCLSKTQKGAPLATAVYPKMCLNLFPPCVSGSLPKLFAFIYKIILENARKKHIFNGSGKWLKKSHQPRIRTDSHGFKRNKAEKEYGKTEKS